MLDFFELPVCIIKPGIYSIFNIRKVYPWHKTFIPRGSGLHLSKDEIYILHCSNAHQRFGTPKEIT